MSAEELLIALSEERAKFTKSDDDKMRYLISKLIEMGEYPAETAEGNPNTVWGMVDGWGAYWHRWSGVLECPHCGADLRNHESGPPFRRQIGMYSRKRDRTMGWKCPDCGNTWRR